MATTSAKISTTEINAADAGKKTVINIGDMNPTLRSAEGYQLLDTAMRAITGLTNGTYIDTTLTLTYSVNEELAEGGS